jgi:hypothetical protein
MNGIRLQKLPLVTQTHQRSPFGGAAAAAASVDIIVMDSK